MNAPLEAVTTDKAERNETIDVAKGIGILLVVMGHNFVLLREYPSLSRGIYLFHMPLFFLLSGLVLKAPNRIGPWVGSRAQALLKPYFVVGISYTLWLTYRDSVAFAPQLIGLLYGIGDTLYLRPMWFLPHLFLSTLVTAAILRGLQTIPRLQNPYAQATFGLCLLAIAPILTNKSTLDGAGWLPDYWNNGTVWIQGLPWSIDLLPFSTGYMMLGATFRSIVANPKPQPTLHIAIAAAAFVIGVYGTGAQLNLDDRTAVGPIYIIPLSLLAIHAVWSISQRIALHSDVIRAGLSTIGRTSLLILIFHPKPQAVISSALWKWEMPSFLVILGGLCAGVAAPLLISMIAQRSKPIGFLLLPKRLPTTSPQYGTSSHEKCDPK